MKVDLDIKEYNEIKFNINEYFKASTEHKSAAEKMHNCAEKLLTIINRIESKKLDGNKIQEDIKITGEAVVKAECDTNSKLNKQNENLTQPIHSNSNKNNVLNKNETDYFSNGDILHQNILSSNKENLKSQVKTLDKENNFSKHIEEDARSNISTRSKSKSQPKKGTSNEDKYANDENVSELEILKKNKDGSIKEIKQDNIVQKIDDAIEVQFKNLVQLVKIKQFILQNSEILVKGNEQMTFSRLKANHSQLLDNQKNLLNPGKQEVQRTRSEVTFPWDNVIQKVNLIKFEKAKNQEIANLYYQRFNLENSSSADAQLFPDPGSMPTYCHCAHLENLEKIMIMCDRCDNWYHETCENNRRAPKDKIPITEEEFEFICTVCMAKEDSQFSFSGKRRRDLPATDQKNPPEGESLQTPVQGDKINNTDSDGANQSDQNDENGERIVSKRSIKKSKNSY